MEFRPNPKALFPAAVRGAVVTFLFYTMVEQTRRLELAPPAVIEVLAFFGPILFFFPFILHLIRVLSQDVYAVDGNSRTVFRGKASAASFRDVKSISVEGPEKGDSAECRLILELKAGKRHELARDIPRRDLEAAAAEIRKILQKES